MTSTGVAFVVRTRIVLEMKEDVTLNRFGRDLAAAIGWLSDLTIDASKIVFELSRLKSYTCGFVSSLH
jgi:hypothetical protein